MTNPKNDLLGRQFSGWRVIAIAPPKVFRSSRQTRWRCVCVCGMEKDVAYCSLVNGASTNCGCLKKLRISDARTTHGMSRSKHWVAWMGMHQRCRNANHSGFKYYGARGIKVCERWRDFGAFWDDMGVSYRAGLTLDRINVDGDYEPSNCRWATLKEQAANKRPR